MRTFIAVDLPAPLPTELAQIQTHIQEHLQASDIPAQAQERGIRWSNPDNIHLTLRFLGNASTAQRETLAPQLSNLAAQTTPFELALDRLGVFPNWRRPSVIWLGLTGALEALGALQAKVEEAVQEAGFDPESKPFRPHLTLARLRRELPRAQQTAIGDTLKALTLQWQADEQNRFNVHEFILYRSDLHPEGPRYTPLTTFTLQ